MTLRNMLTKSLIGLWIILAMAVIPQPAEAVNIQMTNPYSQTMWAAVVFYDGETCPAGSNRRQVKFDKWYMENDGVVYWNP